jgi:hypothetical protein
MHASDLVDITFARLEPPIVIAHRLSQRFVIEHRYEYVYLAFERFRPRYQILLIFGHFASPIAADVPDAYTFWHNPLLPSSYDEGRIARLSAPLMCREGFEPSLYRIPSSADCEGNRYLHDKLIIGYCL